jgi:thiamine-monophosphate kinase
VSDGLLADLGHVCRASRVGAEIELDALPASDALIAAFDIQTRRELQAAGGDDYELCFTAPKTARLAVQDAMNACDVPATRIGRIIADADNVLLRDAAGAAWLPPRAGYVHFEG